MNWYCDYAIDDPVHGSYHDTEYGFPEIDDRKLFERLVLEINQAGLNWGLILKKRDAFRKAFQGYDIETIAGYKDKDRQRLLSDASIIRNRLKVDAVIHNAAVVVELQARHGSFKNWLDHNHPMTKPEWVKLFKKTFRFTGGEITGEFLMSLGYLPGTHREDCPAFRQIKRLKPAWMKVDAGFYD